MKKKDKELKRLRERLDRKKEDFKPGKCPYCGFEKVYKNSTYKRKPRGFFDKLKKGEQKEEVVQDFLCLWCGKSFNIEKRSFFHAHVKDELRSTVGVFRVDGKTSLRVLQDCIQKVLCVDVSLGFVYDELRRVAQIVERINLFDYRSGLPLFFGCLLFLRLTEC